MGINGSHGDITSAGQEHQDERNGGRFGGNIDTGQDYPEIHSRG